MLEYKLTHFNNGLKVITAPLENTKAVTILFLFGVGSRFEKECLNGISHFLEHMFFKGTEKRPTTLDISKELDGVGAGYNAFTGEEYTGYFVRVPSEHFDLGFDVLTDMLYGSKFDAAEIEREKGVIMEELNMYNDDPKSKVDMVLKELMYPEQALGRKITGERATVSKFKRSDFVSYKDKFYGPNNMIAVVAGGTNHQNWLKKLEEKFGGLKSEPFSEYEPETDQAHFILGFRSIPRSDKRRPILKVLTALMGQMMSSRLFIEVRERRGLCYYVNADMAEYRDTGIWAVSAGVDIKRIEEALEVILQEIERIKTEPISDEELKRAQENLAGHLYLSLEESMMVANFLAEEMLYLNKIKDPDDVAKEFRQVTKKEIQELAKELFKKENLNLAVVGPFKEDDKFKKLLENNFNKK
jgi:predicted Zn-dependent peptidase